MFFSIRAFPQLPEGVTLDTSGWIPFPLSSYGEMKGTVLDMSRLLEAPAGKHGFLTVQGDRFVFEDGTVARFWGGNLFGEANFPDKKEAERLADIIARSGANIVRMHHLDVVKPWTDKTVRRSFFGGQMPETTRRIDPVMLDRFFYLFHCLKQRGVYVFLSHLSSRFIMKGDGFPGGPDAFEDVDQGFKVEGMFDPFLIGLQKEYLKGILTVENPYTGVSMAGDPALAMTEIINENSLFWIQPDGSFGINSAHYQKMLKAMFDVWLLKKYKDERALFAAWSQERKTALFSGEKLGDATIAVPHIYVNDNDWPVSDRRKQDTYQFLYDLQDGYYQEMRSFLKGLGLKCPVTGSNHWCGDLADLHVNARMDYVDRHSYWTHPEHEFNYIKGQGIQAKPMVRNGWGGHIGEDAMRRIYGKPYTISEWHNPLPNPYRAEGTPVLAAYASLHGWHPMHYAYWGGRPAETDTINSFEVMFDPTQMNLIPVSALFFHRQDFREDPAGYFEIITPDQAMDPPRRPERRPEVALAGKYGLAFLDQAVPECNNVLHYKKALESGGRYQSVTGELSWDTEKGLVILNSPRTQGVIGFIGNEKVETQSMVFEMSSPFGVVVASSLTDEPLGRSGHILISTSGDARFTGVKISDDFKRIEKTGRFPFLMQTLEGKVTLQTEIPFKVFKLSPGGSRKGEVPTARCRSGYAFLLDAKNKAMHYEIVKE
jgi:hypothetical protein